jgi:hypothetical protein
MGPVSPLSFARMEDTFRNVPADGRSSERTGEVLTCRVWIKDALMALQSDGLAVLEESVGEILARFEDNGLLAN